MLELSNIIDFIRISIDLALVTLMCYTVLKIIITSQKYTLIINGILAFLFLFVIAKVFNLQATSSILSAVFSWGVVIIVVLFKTEIRDSLEQIGRLGSIFNKVDHKISFIDELADTLFDLSETKTGALISIVGNESFKTYTKNSVLINSEFSGLLIKTIFNKEAPLHDGAVVIEEGKIKYASVYYPISLDVNLTKEMGTRHRAALTISELTDAVTIVVSEETGQVSITHKKMLFKNLNKEEFIEMMNQKLESGENYEKAEN